jgi:GDP-L-fucose synthase
MLIFVTGGGGFVGRHLIPELQRHGHEVHAPGSRELDLRDPKALERFSDGSYGRIYHLAAWTRAGRFCEQHGGDQWIVNQQINTNVLSWWATQQPQARIVAFGTSASYAGAELHSEESYMLQAPGPGYYAYAMTKRMLYAGLVALSEQHGLEYLYLVPSTIYGPGYHTDGRDLHFIYDLARKIVRGRRFGDPIVLWGDGSQRRELVYIDDYVEWVIALSETVESEIVNLGEGRDHSIRELAACLCDLVGMPDAAVQFDETKFVGAQTKRLDTRRLDARLPDRPQTGIATGLARTMEWVEQHIDELEPVAGGQPS